MNGVVKKLFPSMSPLCFKPSGELVCYKNGNIIVVNKEKIIATYPLFQNAKERFVGRLKPVYRLLRMGVRATEALDENHIILSVGNTIYEYNFSNQNLSKGYYIGEGIRPLIFTTIKGIEGFDDCVVFGGYRGNKFKEPVHIYKREGIDNWRVIYTFIQGTINHVHNIIPDPYRRCLWVFSGDFDEASAIWKITDNFRKVERVFYGDQKYRACVINVLPEGLLYATDSPLDKDYIFLLNPETGELKEIMPIAGSCIYGCKWKNLYVFESSVEPSGKYKNRLDFFFSREIGPGIQDRYVRIYCGNLENGFKEIYKEKKDCLPYATFQFGAVKFPAGVNNGDTLYFQPIATRKNDLSLMIIEME